MDPELTSLLTQLDSSINNLPLNPKIAAGQIRTFIDRRTNLDRRMADFKADIERRSNDFKNSMKGEIATLQNQINGLGK